MQWDASQRQDVPLIGAGGRQTICFCMHLPSSGSSSNREWSQWFSEGRSGLSHSDPASQLPSSVSFPVWFWLWIAPAGFKPWTDGKVSMPMLSELWSKTQQWNSKHLRWLEHCCESLGGQHSCFHVCSCIGQTTGTIWTRLWWQTFSVFCSCTSRKIIAWAAKRGSKGFHSHCSLPT